MSVTTLSCWGWLAARTAHRTHSRLAAVNVRGIRAPRVIAPSRASVLLRRRRHNYKLLAEAAPQFAVRAREPASPRVHIRAAPMTATLDLCAGRSVPFLKRRAQIAAGMCVRVSVFVDDICGAMCKSQISRCALWPLLCPAPRAPSASGCVASLRCGLRAAQTRRSRGAEALTVRSLLARRARLARH